jgi:hypothetical protein
MRATGKVSKKSRPGRSYAETSVIEEALTVQRRKTVAVTTKEDIGGERSEASEGGGDPVKEELLVLWTLKTASGTRGRIPRTGGSR